MEALAQSPSSGSLIEAVTAVQVRFSRLEADLSAAQREIAQLRRSLAERQPRALTFPEANLASLRRQVAFYCHPDRSGDGELMRRLNVLFDYLEKAQIRVPTAR